MDIMKTIRGKNRKINHWMLVFLSDCKNNMLYCDYNILS